jgi:hypothetical protein
MTIETSALKDTDAFITDLAMSTVAWEPPCAPDCASPTWQKEWNAGSDDVRTNLAHAWLWHFDQVVSLSSGADRENRRRVLLAKQLEFIESVYHHLHADLPYLTNTSSHAACKVLFEKRLPYLSGKEPGGRYLVVSMWLGSEQEKLGALLATESVIHGGRLYDFDGLAQDIAWRVLTLPGATLLHRRAAIDLTLVCAHYTRPAHHRYIDH